MVAPHDRDVPPPAFTNAVAAMQDVVLRPEVTWEEAPAPHRVAPYSAALTADVVVDEVDLATGRLVLLHDPAGHEAWQGTFRCVVYVRADSELAIVADALLGDVAWSWLTEALTSRDAAFVAASGTVTRVTSESFGTMADEPARAEVELRASWTPTGLGSSHRVGPGVDQDIGQHLGKHVEAWGDLLCTAAGLPPIPPGVVPIPQRRVRT